MRGLIAACSILSTSDRDEIVAVSHAAYEIRAIVFPDAETPSVTRVSRVRLEGSTLSLCYHEAPMNVTLIDMPGFRPSIVLSGSAEIALGGQDFPISASTRGAVRPQSSYRIKCGRNFHHFLLEFEEEILRAQAEVITGKPFAVATYPGRMLEAAQIDRLMGPN